MTSGGAEAFKAAIRRSLPIMIGLVVLGVVAVNLFARVQGAKYQATSQVEVSATPLSAIVSGTQPAFVDPQRSQDTAQALANSPQLYQLVIKDSGKSLGPPSDLQSATSVSEVPDTDIIEFAVTRPDQRQAIRSVNAVANGYVAFRAELSGATIASTIAKLQHTLATLSATDPQRTQVENQLKRLQLLQSENASDAVVVRSANSADQTSPAPLKDTALGLSIGLVIALLFVAIREAVDTTIRAESDVEELLSAPVLATVRTLPRRTRIVTYGRHEATFGDTYALLAAQLSPAEKGKQHDVLAVTSALPGEGKTSTAANLAVAAARRGLNVILVDFDFRKFSMTQLFEIPVRTPGAAQVLEGELTLQDAMWNVSLDGPAPVVSQTGRVGILRAPIDPPITTNGRTDRTEGTLRLLPSGPTSDTGPVQRPHLRQLLRELRAEADLVILDTPPALLTVEMTELAQLIDTVIVVVRQGRVTHRSLRTLQRAARNWPAGIAGAVITDARGLGSEYGTYYGSN
jgi:succinoglycan biosynthesis transport protein ExoP